MEALLAQIRLLEDLTEDFSHSGNVPREYLLRILASKQVQLAKISGALEETRQEIYE